MLPGVAGDLPVTALADALADAIIARWHCPDFNMTWSLLVGFFVALLPGRPDRLEAVALAAEFEPGLRGRQTAPADSAFRGTQSTPSPAATGTRLRPGAFIRC